jgi:large subunit ribosomal protein L13
MNTKTYVPKQDQIIRKCFLVDAKGQILGRLATKIAMILMGKDEPFFTPHLECGDQVIVINCEAIRVTGRKAGVKQYKNYSGWPGGLRIQTFEEVLEKDPERIIRDAVKRMLPKNRMQAKMMKRLRVVKGGEHKHAAQKPIPLKLN